MDFGKKIGYNSIREKTKRIEKATEQLEQIHHRTPIASEIAMKVNMTEQEVETQHIQMILFLLTFYRLKSRQRVTLAIIKTESGIQSLRLENTLLERKHNKSARISEKAAKEKEGDDSYVPPEVMIT